jgi:formylmethanofuran dehydrogenase subunit E
MCAVCNAELGAQIGEEMNRVSAEQKKADVIQFVRKIEVPAPTKCSFCGKDLVKGKHVATDDKAICFDCVKTCTELMKGE